MHTLLAQTKNLVRKEKHLTYLILKNLKQIDETKLYCDLGYSSLHSYLEKELGYSSAESALRVANVKLIKRSSLVFEKIKSGDINLTQGATLFQALRRSEVLNKPQKIKEAVLRIVGKSTRESEKIIHDIFETKGKWPQKIFLNERLKEKLVRLKDIYGEKSFEEIIEIMADEKLIDKATPPKKSLVEKISLEKPSSSSRSSKTRSKTPLLVKKRSSPESNLSLNQPELPFMKEVEEPKGRYIPISLRRAIIIRAQKSCEYVGSNGVRCTERRNLEFEHIKPYSHGGGHTLENLKLYCRNHNQRQGILKIAGYLKMKQKSEESFNE